jgi:hypothetical protein
VPHFTFTLLLAILVAAAIALAENRPSSDTFYRAAYLFLYSIGVLVAGGWAMRWIHG